VTALETISSFSTWPRRLCRELLQPHLAALPRAGEPATLAIETQVREDSIRLFAFRRAPSATGFACCRACRCRRQGRAGDFVDPAPDELANAIAMQDKRRSPALRASAEARGAHRRRTEGQGSGLRLGRPGGGAAGPRGGDERAFVGAGRDFGAVQSRLWPSAGGRGGGGQRQGAGRGRRRLALIRRGLKELAG